MLIRCFAAALQGINAVTVSIEVEVSQGINFFLVGLPDSAVRESQRRIESAIRNSGLKLTKKRVVINMAPAGLRKQGANFDLPLAVGILAASGELNSSRLSEYLMVGELSLDGRLRSVKGALSIAIHARDSGFRGIIMPLENAAEASVIKELEVFGMGHFSEVVDFLNGKKSKRAEWDQQEFLESQNSVQAEQDFADVKGQAQVKRAIEIAASGNHNILLVGPPGSGKTMLARRITGILPELTVQESIETTRIHSVAGKLNGTGLLTHRPFRDPHHSTSDSAMIGGGSFPMPGEISLAHNGVLFLDEFPEFHRNVLEVLRQPMESRQINISRARYSIDYPASFMLIAAMNPCPCGYYSHPLKNCNCPPGEVKRYLSRISGPLLDRIDIQVEVPALKFHEIHPGKSETVKAGVVERWSESSLTIRQRVIEARQIQESRFASIPGVNNNSQIAPALISTFCQIDRTGASLLRNAIEKLNFSARAYDRILRIARTVADLEGSHRIVASHIAEAIQYRSLDRSGWG